MTKCPSKYYNNYGTCSECNETCLECDGGSSDDCLSCHPPLVLNESQVK